MTPAATSGRGGPHAHSRRGWRAQLHMAEDGPQRPWPKGGDVWHSGFVIERRGFVMPYYHIS